jgi:hypothetical protein
VHKYAGDVNKNSLARIARIAKEKQRPNFHVFVSGVSNGFLRLGDPGDPGERYSAIDAEADPQRLCRHLP